MNLEFNKFPKIHAIGTRYISKIFNEVVEITEKIDGSQFAFGMLGGKLRMRSKGTIQLNDAPDKMFTNIVESLLMKVDRIPPGFVYYGEYLSKPKHNTLCYTRIPKGYFALFGVYNPENGHWVQQHANLTGYAETLGVDVVPLLFHGKIDSPDELKLLLKRESYLGGPNIEGVVVKNYTQRYMLGDQEMTLMAGKFVSEEFKEVHNKNWKRENTGKGKFEVLKDNYKNPARWMKAVQRLREGDSWDNSPKDIGALIKSVKQDIIEEEKENIKASLWKIFGEEVLRVSIHGLPEWYKERLLENAFEDEDVEPKVTSYVAGPEAIKIIEVCPVCGGKTERTGADPEPEDKRCAECLKLDRKV